MKGLADCAILSPMSSLSPFSNLMSGVFGVLIDILTLLRLIFRSPGALAAENLFLRKQLGLYVERKQKPRRASNAMRFTMAQLPGSSNGAMANDREARYVDSMASKGIPTVLEVEVSGEWPASSSGRRPEVDCPNGKTIRLGERNESPMNFP